MVRIKNKQEIEIMRQGGRILSWVLNEVIKNIKPGVSTQALNDLAEDLIKKKGGRPSFKGYRAVWSEGVYPAALCISINQEVVHGIPAKERMIKAGEVVGLDCGLEYKKYFTDTAKTIIVGRASKEVKKLVAVTKEALAKGMAQVRPGNYISDISRAIQRHVEAQGFSVVRQLVGHGVGHRAHEEPQIPNFVDDSLPDIELKPGMALALEPMVNLGQSAVETLDNGWTIVTADKSLSAHFEHTVVVTERGREILTK